MKIKKTLLLTLALGIIGMNIYSETSTSVKKIPGEKLIGVYDANGGLVGELQYVFEKVFYKKDCALCDITHGLSLSAKKEWIAMTEDFPVEIETLHLNEIDNSIKELVKGKTPCIVYIKGGEKKILVTTAELKECQADPDKLFELLRKKLNLNEK